MRQKIKHIEVDIGVQKRSGGEKEFVPPFYQQVVTLEYLQSMERFFRASKWSLFKRRVRITWKWKTRRLFNEKKIIVNPKQKPLNSENIEREVTEYPILTVTNSQYGTTVFNAKDFEMSLSQNHCTIKARFDDIPFIDRIVEKQLTCYFVLEPTSWEAVSYTGSIERIISESYTHELLNIGNINRL